MMQRRCWPTSRIPKDWSTRAVIEKEDVKVDTDVTWDVAASRELAVSKDADKAVISTSYPGAAEDGTTGHTGIMTTLVPSVKPTQKVTINRPPLRIQYGEAQTLVFGWLPA